MLSQYLVIHSYDIYLITEKKTTGDLLMNFPNLDKRDTLLEMLNICLIVEKSVQEQRNCY